MVGIPIVEQTKAPFIINNRIYHVYIFRAVLMYHFHGTESSLKVYICSTFQEIPKFFRSRSFIIVIKLSSVQSTIFHPVVEF
jgi:hypothetical protein